MWLAFVVVILLTQLACWWMLHHSHLRAREPRESDADTWPTDQMGT